MLMEEFLLDSTQVMLPVCVAALLVAELLLLLKEKRGLGLEIAVATSLCLALTLVAQFQPYSFWAADNRPALLLMVNFLSIFFQ